MSMTSVQNGTQDQQRVHICKTNDVSTKKSKPSSLSPSWHRWHDGVRQQIQSAKGGCPKNLGDIHVTPH